MKVLLINGSPKEKGSTFTILSEVEKSLKDESIDAEIIHIGRGAISDCIACAKCRDKKSGNFGRCAIDNDIVNVILNKAQESDGFVFGSPVYFASASGAVISVMDRLFYSGLDAFKYKPAAAVICARRAGTTAAFDRLNKYFTISAMPVVSSRYWNMVHGNNPEEVRQDLEGMQTMRLLGKNMAWLLKSIEAGKKSGITIPGLNEESVRTNFIR
jgi:multimeric flavodoxin WrbA